MVIETTSEPAMRSLPKQPDEQLWEHYQVDPAKLSHGSPNQSVQNHFSSTDGRMQVGFWKAEPGKWRVNYTENEYCEMLRGVIEMRGDDGEVRVVREGDRFVVPAGFTGTWEVLEPACKLYVIYEA